MPQNQVDLANVFQSVTQSLAQNQQALNQADEYNHDHGDNMVQTFQTITTALQKNQGKPASTALASAARTLARTTQSKSGQLYAQGLAQAATQVRGKPVDERGAMQLLQTLIGGGQAPQAQAQAPGGDLLGALLGGMGGAQQPQGQAEAPGGDLLGALLGGMGGAQQPQGQAEAPGGDLLGALLGGMGGAQQEQPQAQAPAGGDLIGSLLGGLAGGQQQQGGGLSDGLDLGDVLNAGMAYFQAKQSGGSTMQAVMQAFMAASGMGNSKDRTQSTAVVVNSFLQALGGAKK